MKNKFLDNTVITRKISDLSDTERLHLEKICEIGHRKNMMLKAEALDRKRRLEMLAQKKDLKR